MLSPFRSIIFLSLLAFAAVPAVLPAQGVGVNNSLGDSYLQAYEVNQRIELESRKIEYAHQIEQKKIELLAQDLRLKEREAALRQQADSSTAQFSKEELNASVKRLQVIYPDLKKYLPGMTRMATKFRPVRSPEFGPDAYVEGLYTIAKFNGTDTKPCGESVQGLTP